MNKEPITMHVARALLALTVMILMGASTAQPLALQNASQARDYIANELNLIALPDCTRQAARINSDRAEDTRACAEISVQVDFAKTLIDSLLGFNPRFRPDTPWRSQPDMSMLQRFYEVEGRNKMYLALIPHEEWKSQLIVIFGPAEE